MKKLSMLAVTTAMVILIAGCNMTTQKEKKNVEQSAPKNYSESTLPSPISYRPEPITPLQPTAVPKVNDGVKLDGVSLGGLTREEAAEKIKAMAENTDRSAKKGIVLAKTGQTVVSPKTGLVLDKEKTLQAVMQAKAGKNVSPVIHKVAAGEPKKAYLVQISKYATEMKDNRKNRVNNIEIAADEINNVIVMPGEEFSFNDEVGRRSKEKGYEKAPIIVKTEQGPKKKMGVGGGVCQLSTTLYNAAKKAGFSITERHQHSKEVGYVRKGKDATVSYGGKDLRFVNNRKNPLLIKATETKDKVIVQLMDIKIKE